MASKVVVDSISIPDSFNVKWNSSGGIIRVLLKQTNIGLKIKKSNTGTSLFRNNVNLYIEQNGNRRMVANWDFQYNPLLNALYMFDSRSSSTEVLGQSTFTDSRQVIGEESKNKKTGIYPGSAKAIVKLNKEYGGEKTIASKDITIKGSVPTASDIHVTSINPSITNGNIIIGFEVASDIGWGNTTTFSVTATDTVTGENIISDTVTKMIDGSVNIGSYNKTKHSAGGYSFTPSWYGNRKVKFCVDVTNT